MPEFLHEVVARREGTMPQRAPWRDPWTDVLVDEMNAAYQRSLEDSMTRHRAEQRERAIRAAVAGGHSAVTIPFLPIAPTDYGRIESETIHITDEMREQYANVSV